MKGKTEAWPLTPEAVERAAAALAVACNGGDWNDDFTAEHKALWRSRVQCAMSAEKKEQTEKVLAEMVERGGAIGMVTAAALVRKFADAPLLGVFTREDVREVANIIDDSARAVCGADVVAGFTATVGARFDAIFTDALAEEGEAQ